MRKNLFLLLTILLVIIFVGCEKSIENEFDNVDLSSQAIQDDEFEMELDTIIQLNYDSLAIHQPQLLSLNKNRMAKLRSTYPGQSVSDILFDLRDLPVNIIVNENTSGGRFLTAKRKEVKRFLRKTIYTPLPAIFDQKQNDSKVTAQTFYLSYVPLVGDFTISTKFDGTTFPMSVGNYASDPNNHFLFSREGGFNSGDAFTFKSANTEASSFYIENSLWVGSDDPSNPTVWNVWNYTLGNRSSATYFDKYRGLRTQQFVVSPIENFRISKIEYDNDYTAALEKAPDFVITWSGNNSTSVTQQMTTNFGRTASKTSSFSKTTGVQLNITGTLTVGIPFLVEGKTTTSLTTSHTATYGTSETTQDTRNYNFQVVVPPMRRVVATATVSTYKMKLNYTAYLTGVTTGRTVKVKGVWEGVDCADIITTFAEYDLVTNSYLRTKTIKGIPNEIIVL